MKKDRISRVNAENATLIAYLKNKVERTSSELKIEHRIIRETPTKHPRGNSKHRVEKHEAVYAEPAPRRCPGPISAEENLQHWGTRRGLPINKIRSIAAELRKSSQQKHQ